MRRPWTEREIALLRAAAADNRRDGMIKNMGPGRLLALAASWTGPGSSREARCHRVRRR